MLQLITFVAIFSSADELGEFLSDEEVAFGVGEGQKPVQVKAATSTDSKKISQNQEGYVMYCPCMGRFGNQADQFVGSLAFAKGLNRTLVLPPWIVYPNNRPGGSMRIPFSSWFQVKPLQEYHRVVSMDTFMKDIAPTVWPPGKRIGD
ncbi:GDP-fucose protein O-fucosyltransferase 1 [Exaiptasia diaphana]|nr:GDP-fucose protein O-fucosyltransferase 1 [Exaiptasia diaphana]